MRSLSMAVIAVLLGLVQPVHADAIDVRTKQLMRSRDYKVRLSAALWLAKRRDARAVSALSAALAKDSEHTVRRIAAKALGKLITSRIPVRVRKRALAMLKRAATRDRHARVRRSAKRSLTRLASLQSPTSRSGRAALRSSKSNVFINVGRPSLNKRRAPAGMDKVLRDAVKGVLRQKAPRYRLTWKSGKLPTREQLQRANARGWYVGTTVSQLEVRQRGGMAEVRCAVSLRVNRWQGRGTKHRWTADNTASATGKGKVTGPNTKRGIDGAKRDCVLAVAESVTAKQVVPFLARRNR